MEQKGILVACVGSQSGTSRTTGNPWRTDEYLLKIPGQRERKIKFEVRGVERCEQWKNFFEGMPNKDVTPVLVKFEIDAREYEGKWFNTIEAWNIEVTTW